MKKLIILLSLGILFNACDDVLDINTDPNNPATSTTRFTLPAGQVGMASRLGFDYNLLGSVLVQHWTQGPTASQYSFLETYTINNNSYTGAWSTMYATSLRDLEFIRTQSIEDGTPNITAVAMLMQAYGFQVLVDLYDQIPYFDALQGKDGVLQPEFNTAEEVYNDLIIKIDEALGLIDLNQSAVRPGVEDLIYGGDMTKWIKFANTLKLKIYMRQSGVRQAVAQAGIQQMYANGDEFIGVGEDAMINFSTATQNENPLWQNLNQTTFQNLVASETSEDYLNDMGDTRIDAFYDVAPNSGLFRGLTQGVGVTSGEQYGDFSPLDPVNIISNTAPVVFFSAHESLFLQAEAAARNFSSASAATLYNEAVTASFSSFGLDASFYINTGGVYEYDGTIEQIITQKWIALNGTQGFEAWSDWRRTGFPNLNPSATTTLPGGQFPLRLIFPSNESASNPNVPALQPLTAPVWWDVD